MIRTGKCASPLSKVYLSNKILSVLEGEKERYSKNTWSEVLSDSYLWELL